MTIWIERNNETGELKYYDDSYATLLIYDFYVNILGYGKDQMEELMENVTVDNPIPTKLEMWWPVELLSYKEHK